MAAPEVDTVIQLSSPVAGTPGVSYLEARKVHSPELPLLPNLCWLPADAGLRWPDTLDGEPAGPVIPATAAGALVYLYSNRAHRYVAAELEILTADGRQPDPRKRYTFGSRKGAAFLAPWYVYNQTDTGQVYCTHGALGDPISEIHLAEGVIDALRLRIDQPRCQLAIAAGGCGNLDMWIPDCAKLVIHADGDIAGQRWAIACRDRVNIRREPPETEIIYYKQGQDPAS